MLGLASVLELGAKKYDDDNWRKGMKFRRVADALLRHVYLWLGGEDKDQESGLLHMDHVLANAMFLSEYQHTGTGVDDRWTGSDADPMFDRTEPPPELDNVFAEEISPGRWFQHAWTCHFKAGSPNCRCG